MKKVLKVFCAILIISVMFFSILPKVWASNNNDDANNTKEVKGEIIEEIDDSVSKEKNNAIDTNPYIAYARIDKNGKITIHVKNMKTTPEILINDKKVNTKAVGLYTFEVVDKSLMNTTAKISLKFSKDNIISKSFYLSAGKDFNYEKTMNEQCLSSVKNVFADNDNVYMYSPKYRMIYKLEEKTRYGCDDSSYWIADYAIEDMLNGEYLIQNEDYDLKEDNTEFVIINGVIYTYYTFDFNDGKKNYILMSIDMKNGNEDVKKVTELPNECKLTKPTLAVYNGNLYVIGGYNEKDNTVSKRVYEYNIKTKKWTKKADLPEGRFAATANQVGDKLIVSFGGKSDGKVPCNLIYDGKTWKKSKASIEIKTSTGKVNNKKYYKPSVGIVLGGLVYSGVNAEKLGNVFYYDIATDSYKESGYNIDNNNNTLGVALGNKYYLINKNQDVNGNIIVRSMPIKSGLSKLTIRYPSSGIKAWVNADVTSKRKSDDNIYNIYYYMPGDIIGFKLTDMPGYYYSHFKVDDKEVNGYSYNGPIGADKEIKITKARNIDLIRLNKISGDLSYFNTLQLTAKVWDKNATPIVWTSKYPNVATVSSTGLVTPKVKGLDNTARIIASTTLYGRNISVDSELNIIKPVIYNIKITKITDTSNSLYWTPLKGADGYEVYIWNGYKNEYEFYKRINTNSITVTGLKNAYYNLFGIKPFKNIDGKRYYGEMNYVY